MKKNIDARQTAGQHRCVSIPPSFQIYRGQLFPDPAYWRINGRPVIVIWGNHSLSADAWRAGLNSETVPPDGSLFLSFPAPEQSAGIFGLIDGFYPWMEIKDVEGQRSDLKILFHRAGFVKAGRSKHLCAGVWPVSMIPASAGGAEERG